MLAKLHQPVAKTATVGAASVIGEEELSKKGFAVGLLARRVDRLSQICTELESHPPRLTAHGCYLGESFGGLPPSCPWCVCGIWCEGGHLYLAFAVAGESRVAIAEILENLVERISQPL